MTDLEEELAALRERAKRGEIPTRAPDADPLNVTELHPGRHVLVEPNAGIDVNHEPRNGLVVRAWVTADGEQKVELLRKSPKGGRLQVWFETFDLSTFDGNDLNPIGLTTATMRAGWAKAVFKHLGNLRAYGDEAMRAALCAIALIDRLTWERIDKEAEAQRDPKFEEWLAEQPPMLESAS